MKSGRNPEDVYQEIKDIGVSDISMEVMGSDLEMYDEGVRLYEKFGDVATIEVPCTREGLIVYSVSEQGIKVNVTLIFRPLRQSCSRLVQHMSHLCRTP